MGRSSSKKSKQPKRTLLAALKYDEDLDVVSPAKTSLRHLEDLANMGLKTGRIMAMGSTSRGEGVKKEGELETTPMKNELNSASSTSSVSSNSDNEHYDEDKGRKPGNEATSSKQNQKAMDWSHLFAEKEQEGVKYYATEEVEGITMGRIPKQEVEQSAKLWDTTVVCKVIGSFPPHIIMNGFFRRIWRKYPIQKIWLAKKGVFLVRFAQKDHRDEVIRQGMVLFDNKPVIVQEWSPKLDFTLPATVPIWIQMPGLDVVYWKDSIISRIISPIGIPLRLDRATQQVERLSYARIMVEVPLGKHIPQTVPYIDENDIIQHQKITCEWYPATCAQCGLMGHNLESCKRKEEQKGKEKEEADAPAFQKPRRWTNQGPATRNQVYIPVKKTQAPPSPNHGE